MNVFVGFYFILILIEKNVLKISKTFLDTTPLKIFFFAKNMPKKYCDELLYNDVV